MTIGTVRAVTPLAHQGGWDELLVVLAPMLVLVGLLVLATRRVNAKLGDGEPAGGEEHGQSGAGQSSSDLPVEDPADT